MATASIGPGFLTQTAVFTDQLKASFAFAIVVSIIINLVVQLNVWRILAVSEMRAQDVANKVFPGLGYLIAFLVALGGLVFNIGNVAGAAMGLNVVTGLPIAWGAVISAFIAIMLFLSREMGRAMDQFTKILGFIMIALVLYTVFVTNPPASAFKLGAGEIGYRIFGVILWAAGITSVVGASFTSISFLQTLFDHIQRNNRWWIIGFIVTSTIVLVTVGQPVTLLIFAGQSMA